MYKLQTDSPKFLRVVEGDSLADISKRYNIPEIVLINDNNLKEEIAAGDILILGNYNMRIYKVKLFESVMSICRKFNMTTGEFRQVNGIDYVFCGLNVFVKR